MLVRSVSYKLVSLVGALIRKKASIREGLFIRSFTVHICTRKDAS